MLHSNVYLNKHWLRVLVVLVLLAGLSLLTSGKSLAQVSQSGCYELWNTTLIVSDTLGASQTLTFGQGLFATNGTDPCDQLAPPAPPVGSFYANWLGTNAYFTEYRQANLPGTVTWSVEYRAGSGGNPITFSWNPAELPGAGTWRLRDQITGTLINVDMRAQNSFVDPFNGAITQLNVVYDTTRCTVTAVADGDWNTPGTWNNNCTGIPTATDDIYIPPGIDVDFGSTPATSGSLTVDNGASLIFSGPEQLTVAENAFNRGGLIDLGTSGNLVVDGRMSNYGRMRQIKTPSPSATFLDIGGYGGMVLTANSGSTLVEIKGGQLCDTDNTATWRCFYVTPTNNVTDAAVTFFFTAEELNTSDCSTVQAWRSAGGTSWVSAGLLGTRACASEPYSISYSGMTVQSSRSIFALRSVEEPTAVNLLQMQTNTSGIGWIGGTISLLLLISMVVLLRPRSLLQKR